LVTLVILMRFHNWVAAAGFDILQIVVIRNLPFADIWHFIIIT